jgi:phosphoribosyl 1,2-cyclic phosphodiesterase
MIDAIVVKFWGVRGSHPAPGPETVRYGGNTPCVEIRIRDRTIILDAGTGIIPLGRDLSRRSSLMGKPVDVTLLLSHLHHDHTQGLPFFSPAYISSTRMQIFGPDFLGKDLQKVLAQNMTAPVFPIAWGEINADKSVQNIHEGQALWIGESGAQQIIHPADRAAIGVFALQNLGDPICIRTLRSYAHPGSVLVFRLEWRGRSIVYATDMESLPGSNWRLVNFARRADLFIHDAQFTDPHYHGLMPGLPATQGWGHSTTGMACDIARAAGVKRLALFHYDPGYDDRTIEQNEADARRRFSGAVASYEGMEITLAADEAFAAPRGEFAQVASAEVAV